MSQDKQISEGPTCIDALTSKFNLAPELCLFLSNSKEKEYAS